MYAIRSYYVAGTSQGALIMAKEVRAIVIAGNGTNCEREVAQACRMGGADVCDIVHIAELLSVITSYSIHYTKLYDP